MDKPVSLEVVRGNRKEPCLYCGKEEHPSPLACPRISCIFLSADGHIECIEFRDDWTPDLAG